MTLITPPENTASMAIERIVETKNETYLSLVWRRLKRSWTGVMGLVLVAMLLIMALFAPFFAPVDPKFR